MSQPSEPRPNQKLGITSPAPRPMFELRGVVYRDTRYGIYVGRCLQTGHVVTADDRTMVREMLIELLEDEIAMAIKTGNVRNLFGNPAPIEEWRRWLVTPSLENIALTDKTRRETIATLKLALEGNR